MVLRSGPDLPAGSFASLAAWRPPGPDLPAVPARLLIVALLLVFLAVPTVVGVNRVCGTPVDVSGTTRLPDWLVNLKERDEIAFPLHAWLGAGLVRLGCEPTAAGLQWVKAAAHARSADDLDQAVAGLIAARANAGAGPSGGSPDRFEAEVCGYLTGGSVGPNQAAALARAGLDCPSVPRPGS